MSKTLHPPRRSPTCGCCPPRKSTLSLKPLKPRGGRPLSQPAAWRSILAASVDFDDPYRYENRGVLARYSAGSGMVSSLLARSEVVVSGMHAAAAYVDMLDPLADEAQLYIQEGWQQRLDPLHPMRGLAPSSLGRVLVRAVSEASWEELRERSGVAAVRSADNGAGLVAPAPVVALDLCVSPHPREQRVAGAIIESFP